MAPGLIHCFLHLAVYYSFNVFSNVCVSQLFLCCQHGVRLKRMELVVPQNTYEA